MNYITEINKFYDWLETNDIPKSAVALWNALMHINNKAEWKQTFEVAISTLEFKTKFKRSELFEARNILTQKGRIKWRSRGGSLSASYEMVPFCVRIMDASADAKGYTNPDTKAYSSRTQKGTINKLNKEETKRNNSFPADEPPAPEKKEIRPFWKKFVETYENFYTGLMQADYVYQKKDMGCLSKIYDFLKTRAGQKSYEWTEKNMAEAFQFFLTKAAEKDGWLKANFSIPNLLSQFNQIANGQGQATSAGKNCSTGKSKATGAELHTLHAKRFGQAG